MVDHAWLSSALLIFTFGLSLISYAPQALRCLKTRDPAGIAPISMAMGFANYLLWNVYYWAEQSQGLLLMNIATTLVYAFMLATTVYARVQYGRNMAGPVLYTIGVLGLFMFWEPSVGLALLLGAAWYFGSALKEALDTEAVGGLSPGMWWFMLAYGFAYVMLGALGAPLAALLWGLMATFTSLSMLFLINRKGGQLEPMHLPKLH